MDDVYLVEIRLGRTKWRVRQTILSLAPKSVTAGIAVGISEQIGGLQTLTIVLVIMTGITGAVLGPIVARLAGINDPRVV